MHRLGEAMRNHELLELNTNVTTVAEFDAFSKGMIQNLHQTIRVEPNEPCPALTLFQCLNPLAIKLMDQAGVESFEHLSAHDEVPEEIVVELMKLKESHYDPYMTHLVTS